MERGIDAKDALILRMLERNAKERAHVMARKLGMPASTVHHRIKQMEKKGIIKAWSIVKDHARLGFGLKAHVLVFADTTELKRLKKDQMGIAREIHRLENVECADIITGDAELLVTVRCKDMGDFQKFLLEKLQRIDGVSKTKTMMVVAEE